MKMTMKGVAWRVWCVLAALAASPLALWAKKAAEVHSDTLADGTIPVVTNSIVPTHRLATFILNFIDGILDRCGLEKDKGVEEIIYIVVIIGVAWLIGIILEKIILFLAHHFIRLRKMNDTLVPLFKRTLTRCAYIIPPVVFLCLIPFAFQTDHNTLKWILRIVVVYTLFTLGMGLTAVLEFAWARFELRDNQDKHPLKGVLNICRGLVWIIIVIISVSVLIDRSPMSLLAGLGAFAAALMLIFKDSILGFVAGIQLSQNDMLRVGDWIVVPSTIANGIVIDVTLSVVKVQNWDNTIVMLPPYTLISTSFQNYRGMFDAGSRLINQSVYIDHSTVLPATPEMLSRLSAEFPELGQYIKQRQEAEARGEGNEYNQQDKPNGTIATNLGLFRAYCCQYLLGHPKVDKAMSIIVMVQPPTSYGVNLNFYFYSLITSWIPYEGVQSEIFEHIVATAPRFGLTVYNAPDRNAFTIKTEAATPANTMAAAAAATAIKK